VILLNDDRREELRLQEDPGARPPTPKRVARRGRTRRSRRSTGTETSSLGSLSERLKDLQSDSGLSRSAADLLTQGRLLPKYSDGEMVGMQVNDIQPGSLYETLGIEDGDVISSVNGIPIDSAAAGSKILRELTDAEEFRIEREGKSPITFGPEQLEEALSE
jgi:type II secretory pathway component PulC